MKTTPDIERVAFVGTYLPRKCGIATFTDDLCEAVAQRFPQIDCGVTAMNDEGNRYQYSGRVIHEIPEENRRAYREAAAALNATADVVSLQHEYGIFGGGDDGPYLLDLLRNLKIPVVTTMHSVRPVPSPEVRRTTIEIARLSDRIVVISDRARQFLEKIYGVKPWKIDVIPHGIHELPWTDPDAHKGKFGLEGRFVVLTFGLMSRNKNLEDVIRALPAVVRRHPEVIYLMVGATHPNAIRKEGEAYRDELRRLAVSLRVEDHLIFENRFVSLEELKEYLLAADVYITPYRGQAQVSSGTLAYALGAGKEVISTPYQYAREMLADGCGVLVPFADPSAIGKALNFSIEDGETRKRIQRAAWEKGRSMIWPRVAEIYQASFQRARADRMTETPARLRTGKPPIPSAARHGRSRSQTTSLVPERSKTPLKLGT